MRSGERYTEIHLQIRTVTQTRSHKNISILTQASHSHAGIHHTSPGSSRLQSTRVSRGTFGFKCLKWTNLLRFGPRPQRRSASKDGFGDGTLEDLNSGDLTGTKHRTRSGNRVFMTS